MKSLEELKAIKDKAIVELSLRKENPDAIFVRVGMGTCGIAAGAKDVLLAFVDEISKRKLLNVRVIQTSCVGMCTREPIVEVTVPGEEKVTYVDMTPEKAVRVVNDHLVNKNVVAEYTIGANS